MFHIKAKLITNSSYLKAYITGKLDQFTHGTLGRDSLKPNLVNTGLNPVLHIKLLLSLDTYRKICITVNLFTEQTFMDDSLH